MTDRNQPDPHAPAGASSADPHGLASTPSSPGPEAAPPSPDVPEPSIPAPSSPIGRPPALLDQPPDPGPAHSPAPAPAPSDVPATAPDAGPKGAEKTDAVSTRPKPADPTKTGPDGVDRRVFQVPEPHPLRREGDPFVSSVPDGDRVIDAIEQDRLTKHEERVALQIQEATKSNKHDAAPRTKAEQDDIP